MPGQDGPERNTWKPNAITITPTNEAITASSLRKPRLCSPRMTNAATPTSSAAGKSGRPVSRLMPIAAPTNSAMSVAIAISSACTQSPNVTRRGNRSRQTSGQVHPGRDPELRAHRLDQHRHQVRDEDDPEQQVAELRSARHVGREVAGIDVGDRGDEGRPEERRVAADARAARRSASAPRRAARRPRPEARPPRRRRASPARRGGAPASGPLSGCRIGAHPPYPNQIFRLELNRARSERLRALTTTTGLVAIGVQPSLSTSTTRTRAGRGIRTSPSET